MNIDEYGIINFSENEIFENLYAGKLTTLKNVHTTADISEKFNFSKNINKDNFEEIQKYNKLYIDKKIFDKLNQKEWFMPENYCPNLIENLFEKCNTDIEKNRLTDELELFIKHNMLDLLFYLKYLVDVMRKNNIVWGVGRGSSVSSYVLYLIGVHKINPIKYNLDINEFLK